MEESISMMLQKNEHLTAKQNNEEFNKIEDIDAFLRQIDIHKNATLRLIAWCIKLEIVSESFSSCLSEIADLNDAYQALIQSNISENTDYYTLLNNTEKETLQNDLVRTILWYKQLAQTVNFQIQDLDKVQFRAGRILSLISLTDKELSYTQGYDRYIFITLLEAQVFCSENHLSDDFAEALSFYISKRLITLAKCHVFLDDIKIAEQFFKKYDKIAEKYTPNIQNELTQAGQGSLFYALKWHIVLFADEYNFPEILVIWDNIILNHQKFDDYMECLYVSQMEQIEKKGDPKMMPAERIQRFHDSDMGLFVQRANTIFAEKTSDSSITYGAIGTVAIFAIATAAFFFLRYRRHKGGNQPR